MTKYFAAINPATNEIDTTRSTETRYYQNAVAVSWGENDDFGAASFHADVLLAEKAAGSFRNRGAQTQVWEVREITKAEFKAHRAGIKAQIEKQASEVGFVEDEPVAQDDTETIEDAAAVIKRYKLSKPMVRDLLTAINTHVSCHDGMTSKGLRARDLMVEGTGRAGMLTDEGMHVVRVLRGVA